jgi:hypothetical protein
LVYFSQEEEEKSGSPVLKFRRQTSTQCLQISCWNDWQKSSDQKIKNRIREKIVKKLSNFLKLSSHRSVMVLFKKLS